MHWSTGLSQTRGVGRAPSTQMSSPGRGGHCTLTGLQQEARGWLTAPQEPRGLHADLCDTAPEQAPARTYFWEGGPCRLAGLLSGAKLLARNSSACGSSKPGRAATPPSAWPCLAPTPVPPALPELCPEAPGALAAGSHLWAVPGLLGLGVRTLGLLHLSAAWAPSVLCPQVLAGLYPVDSGPTPICQPQNLVLYLSPETWDRCPNSFRSPAKFPLNRHTQGRDFCTAWLHPPTPAT